MKNNGSMQALMAQANKMKRDLAKANAELAEKEFSVTKGGGITVAMTGDRQIVEVSIEDDLFDKDNKEMIESMLIVAVNELLTNIAKEEEKINEAITGSAKGFL